jgi:chlorophyllase
MAGTDATVDINSAAETTNWLPQGLHYLLPPLVQPNMRKLGLAGHSRGGKAAFALALKRAATSLKFCALIGVDPVDGLPNGNPIPPPVTNLPHPFHLDMPVMVIGTELGEMGKHCCCCTLPAAAPKGINHEDFFRKCEKPACHLVAKDYGHCDMLDDKICCIYELLMCLCFNSGNSRKPMRRFVGGAIVAFMKAYLLGDKSDYMAIIDETLTPPVVLEPIEFLE